MKILVEIVHPADVLFFLNPIRIWQSQGHRILVASRRKDVTIDLLDAFAIEHHVISSAGSRLLTLGMELAQRDVALWRVARKFRPDVMCGFGGVAISHVGRLMSIPAISFYDTERAPLQHKLTLPFISHLYVPESYDGPVARGRTTRFPGTKDFSYLHPENFVPDRGVALAAGLAEGMPNYFLRLVGWQANHDIGRGGWNADTLQGFVDSISSRGRVHISSELPLPPELECYRYRGPVAQVHHLLASCNCYIGESATMAGEAVLLGVPAIYAANDRRCYTDELAEYGLLWKLPAVDSESLCRAVAETAALEPGQWAGRLANYLDGKINLARYIAREVLSHSSAVS